MVKKKEELAGTVRGETGPGLVEWQWGQGRNCWGGSLGLQNKGEERKRGPRRPRAPGKMFSGEGGSQSESRPGPAAKSWAAKCHLVRMAGQCLVFRS